MSDLNFSYEPESDVPRQAYRAKVPGLTARVAASGAGYNVQDVSAGGVSLEDPGETLKGGDVLELDLLLKDRVIIAGLRAQLARRHKESAGLKFTDITQRQEERLDKLVLEVQKYLISKRKIGGSHIDDEQET
ncbi:MAG: PilZ domain-containing protein [Thermodesulfobacteriota bacterium]|jgi:hypothetical protein